MNSSFIIERFRNAARTYPERIAVIGGETEIRYASLERRAAACAATIGQKIQGPVVAMLLPNTHAFPPLLLGALWAGKSVAMLPTLAPPPLLKLMVAEAGAEVVITTEELVPRLVEVGIPCWIGEVNAECDPQSVPVVKLARESAVMLYTSGTTGRPKTVVLSEANILANIDGCVAETGFTDHEVMLAVLPLFHAYGLTVTVLLPLTMGAQLIVAERFVPRAVLQTIEHHKVTCIIAVPSQFRVLAKEPTEIDASSLWLCIAGGERLPEVVATEFEARFHHPIAQGYGTTEASPVISLNIPETNRHGSVGKPLPNTKVTIRDEQDRVLKAREIGEVCVEGPTVMLGYHRDADNTARKISNGVLHTGDKGYFDEDGYLFLVGRADDLAKVSGEKVYPAEVEKILESFEGVDEAAVVAFPDEKHGSRLHAFLTAKPGAKLNDAALRTACRDHLEPFKVPRTFSFVDQMPRTITGKTDKRTLATTAV